MQHEKGIMVGELEERVDEEFDKYQDRMAELMHDINIDCFTVGFYQTNSISECMHRDVIESLAAYQELVDKAILLCFDPHTLTQGGTPFTALRVTQSFIHKFNACEHDLKEYAKINHNDILQEVLHR